MPLISVVIPVYRAEKCLQDVCRRVGESLTKVSVDYEIILVEDCGGDRSWEIIQELAESNSHIRGFTLSRNFGQHAATLCGISKARGEWIVTIDDDLEQKPEDIPELFKKAKEGYDLVYGIYPQRKHSQWRNWTSTMARRLFSLAIPSLNTEYTSFRIIRKKVALELCNFKSPSPFVDGYLSWLTNNYSTVSVAHSSRSHGVSNYTFRKLLSHTINIFVTFSDLPLKFATWLGLVSFVVGMFWLLCIVLVKFFGGITVSGFSSLMAGIVLFGGIQMLVLGVIGEYLGRMNFKSSQMPLFSVADEVGTNEMSAE